MSPIELVLLALVGAGSFLLGIYIGVDFQRHTDRLRQRAATPATPKS